MGNRKRFGVKINASLKNSNMHPEEFCTNLAVADIILFLDITEC